MTTRRTFVAGSLAAAAALALPTSARAETRSARIRTKDSTELHVKEWGASGRTVIFTHAWPLSADIWDYQAAALAEAGYRVLAYDRRGFGRSSQPAAGYDFDTLSDDLAAVIAETGARDITLVGYSMGGGEIVRYFSRHGGKQVAKAALVGAAASYLLKTDANPDGLDRAVFDGIKQGVLGDRRAYLDRAAERRVLRCQAAGHQSRHAGNHRLGRRHRHAGRSRGDRRLRRFLQPDGFPARTGAP